MGNPTHNNLSDEELLLRFRRTGDNNWLGVLLQRYTLLLLGVAFKYLKDREQAQDAVQQVFYTALTKLPDGEIHNFKGWLYILVRNHCLQLLRDQTFQVPPEALQTVPAVPDRIEEHIEKDFTLGQMHEALGQLNEEQQTTLRMFYLERKSYQQIMDLTGYSFMQVKSFIQNGKRNLKNILLRRLGKET